MTRTLTILTTVAALAVSAAPAWAGDLKQPPKPSGASVLENTMVTGYSVKARSARPTVTMLDYEGSPVVTYVKPSGLAKGSAKGRCDVRGFMDYTDDACMSRLRWQSSPSALLSDSNEVAVEGVVAPQTDPR